MINAGKDYSLYETGYKYKILYFRGWNVSTLDMGGADALPQRIKSFGMTGSWTFVVDPLAAKSLKEEGWNDPDEMSKWLADRLGSSFFKPKPKDINFVVVGGETNPIWQSTDYVYYKTASVDKWIPEDGIKLDEKPIRMPTGNTKCKDGLCTFGM